MTERTLAVLLLVAATACRSAPDTPVVVEFWALGREGEMVARLVPEFERRVPGVRVRVQQIPWSAAHEKLLTAYVGRALPDVVQVGNTWLPELVTVGALAPLDARLARKDSGAVAGAGTVALEDYFAGAREATMIDGRTWALPWYVDTRVLFYRTDLLRDAGYASPPVTWEGWLDALAQVKRRAGPAGYAVLLPLTEWETPVILALQRGAELLRAGGRHGNFRSPPFRAALAFYQELFTRALAPRAGAAQVANVYQDFARGYFAAYVSGPWNLGELARRLPPALAERWATAPMPALDGPGPGVSLAGGASLAITATSRHPDAAWRWIEYLAEPERAIEFYGLTGDLPPTARAWEMGGLAEGARTRAFWTQMRHVAVPPQIPEWERIATKVGDYAEAVVRERMTVDGALAALDADVDGILEKRRWLLDTGRLAQAPAQAGDTRTRPETGDACAPDARRLVGRLALGEQGPQASPRTASPGASRR